MCHEVRAGNLDTADATQGLEVVDVLRQQGGMQSVTVLVFVHICTRFFSRRARLSAFLGSNESLVFVVC